jgi:mono/diheme cytochrome c family protein
VRHGGVYVSVFTTAVVRTAVLALCLLGVARLGFAQTTPAPPTTGAELYRAACSTCHGLDGGGAPPEVLAFSNPVPDFTDCEFGPREPDTMWLAITHQGGPARAFNQIMPAFGDALTIEEIQLAVSHVRTLCANPDWPRGELNFPKALITEKAFPEDEVVVTTTAALEGAGAVSTRAVYERRFGARTQMEFGVPIRAAERTVGDGGTGQWVRGVGDVAVALKRVLVHSLARGQILSATAEVVVPTGSESQGLGAGTGAIEPFVTYGQLLPANWFVQTQSGFGFPWDTGRAKDAFWRVAVGRSFVPRRWGRVWSPMVEVLGGRELVRGEPALWDVLPEMQVTLSTRQHVRANVGVRVPINHASTRSTQFLTYVLWDWYEGPFFGGW